ncbi:hypothetical protein PIB30_093598, partial [Stylosanthes scabra]|nr:hypothetical protein [Stylosanthes scabra]
GSTLGKDDENDKRRKHRDFRVKGANHMKRIGMFAVGTKETGKGFESCMAQRRGMVKPEYRVGLPRVDLLAYLLGFWRFIRTENPWVGDSHFVYFRLFRYRFELGKLAKHSSGVYGLASPLFESWVESRRRISEVCPEYVIGFRMLCNEPGLRRLQFVYRVEPLGYMYVLSCTLV